MKRGATWAALAATVLLAILWGQRFAMGTCSIEHKIITPDGAEFAFTGPRIMMGSLEADWPLEGEGLPPVEHLSQEIYGMPGAIYKGAIVKPRVLTITLTTHGVTRQALHDINARMYAMCRLDRGEPGKPSIYRYTINGVSRDLYVYYDTDVKRSVGRPGLTEVVGIRMIAFDPYWYDPVTQEQVLDWQDNLTVLYVAAREDGIWNAMGPPAAVAAGIVTIDVYAIAVDPLTGYVYVAGDFTNWNNEPLADYLVRWTGTTWEAIGDDGIGGPALTERVYALHFGPDRTLYVGGRFHDAGGVATADHIAQVNPDTLVWADVGGGPGAGAVTVVNDILVGGDMTTYVTGSFTNWAGLGSPAGDHIVRLALGGAWATVGNGLSALGNCLAEAPNGHVIVGGAFVNAGAVACNNIAEWDGAAWDDLDGGVPGGGTAVNGVAFAPNGKLVAVGNIPTIGSGPTTVNNVATWNGTQWSACGTGLNFPAYGIVIDRGGTAYITGAFTMAGGLTVDRMARWTGAAWGYLDIDIPDTPALGNLYGAPALGPNDELYLGFRNTGVALVAGDNVIINAGNTTSYPIIEIKNRCYVRSIRNETTNREMLCTMQMQDGEIVAIDLSPGVKSCESTWRGSRLDGILPDSDMATFCLESDPRAAYGAVPGSNLLTIFITDAIPRETGDNNNQLSAWANITGVAQSNTDYGRLYMSIVADGGGFYHVNLYMDRAKAAVDLVGHTAGYNGAGAKAIVADNASGLGGTITVDAVVGADTNIEVWFTIVTMFWRNRWDNLNAAVS